MEIQQSALKITENVAKVIVGKEEVTELCLAALWCEGHILLEDVPGIGKTTLAKAIARSLCCTFKRIQFTPDLMPSVRKVLPSISLTARCGTSSAFWAT